MSAASQHRKPPTNPCPLRHAFVKCVCVVYPKHSITHSTCLSAPDSPGRSSKVSIAIAQGSISESCWLSVRGISIAVPARRHFVPMASTQQAGKHTGTNANSIPAAKRSKDDNRLGLDKVTLAAFWDHAPAGVTESHGSPPTPNTTDTSKKEKVPPSAETESKCPVKKNSGGAEGWPKLYPDASCIAPERGAEWQQGPSMQQAPRCDPACMFDLYRQDRLIMHSIPNDKTTARAPCLNKSSCLMSGTLLFYKGLRNQHKDKPLANGAARFGDADRVKRTVFATLHDLERVWQAHADLEAQKPPGQRCPAGPYLYFTPYDMCDAAKAHGGQPPEDYLDCVWDQTPPKEYARTRDYDLRHACEETCPHELPPAPTSHSKGTEWNEIRAALSYDNLVGLCFIHDPAHDPREHAQQACRLQHELETAAHVGPLEMYVFRLFEENGVNGELMVVQQEQEQAPADTNGTKTKPDAAVTQAIEGKVSVDAGEKDSADDGAGGSAGVDDTCTAMDRSATDSTPMTVTPGGEGVGIGRAGKVAERPVRGRLMTFSEYLQQQDDIGQTAAE